jgi:hypothetical protein
VTANFNEKKLQVVSATLVSYSSLQSSSDSSIALKRSDFDFPANAIFRRLLLQDRVTPGGVDQTIRMPKFNPERNSRSYQRETKIPPQYVFIEI